MRMRVDEGRGYCPECEKVVDLRCEDNSHGCHTVWDYIPECAECFGATEEYEPDDLEPKPVVGSQGWMDMKHNDWDFNEPDCVDLAEWRENDLR